MLFGPDPLAERLTLLWHNHFATSNLKVDDLALMRRQNETLRSLCRGPVRPAPARDAPRPGAPGLARCPGEPQGASQREPRPRADGAVHPRHRPLFRGRRQAGRPRPDGLDGRGRRVPFVPVRHDAGTKTILGRTAARSTPTDWPRCCSEHPATSRRLAWRICHEFLGEGAVDDRAIDALAEGLRAHDLDVGWGVATVLRSRLFFDAANLGRRVASPVDFVVGAVRALEMFDPPPSTLVLADWCGRLGQDLFYPPNVGGWPGGRTWITTRSALGRAELRRGPGRRRVGRPGYVVRPDRAGRPPWPGSEIRRSLRNCCSVPMAPRSPRCAGPARQALVRLLASPEAQRI